MAILSPESSTAEWKQRMAAVSERVPLVEVARWWIDMWEWRTAELEAGRGNPYDLHPSYRAPWSMAVTKYPWLNTGDRCDLEPLVQAEMKKRSRKNPAMREWYQAMKKERKDRGHER